jgi:phosphohistidine phosphatase SixA
MTTYYILLLPLLLLASCSSSSEIYVVRHAEKAVADHGDPPLTLDGETRSIALAELLEDKQIDGVFSTSYLRTRLTAEPTAQAFGLPIELYHHDTLPLFVKQRIHPGKNYLIVGHSNTVLEIVKALGAQPSIAEIHDEDYDNLFIVTQKFTPFGQKNTLVETTFKP